MIVVDFDAPERLRAFARFDSERLANLSAADAAAPGALLGAGHLAFTVDEGGEAARYQGVVALDGQGFEAAAHEYFRQSEQIPTLVRLAVAQSVTSAGAEWRAGGLLAQFLPDSPERRRKADLHPGDAPAGVAAHVVEEDDAWIEARALAATVEDHELVDPTLSSERLLYRLFHERGVAVFEAGAIREACRCSEDRIRAMLRSFSPEDRRAMIGDDGRIGVTCEFCSSHASFEPEEFEEAE
jgi:molecular chaperone Hsp33